jgi:hypothetical protein
VESPKQPEHLLFIDLISNIGPRQTTGLLLKIALLSRKAKPHLEKRFSILFNHYESQAVNDILWFVNLLENLNVALTLNFGSVDLHELIFIAEATSENEYNDQSVDLPHTYTLGSQ